MKVPSDEVNKNSEAQRARNPPFFSNGEPRGRLREVVGAGPIPLEARKKKQPGQVVSFPPKKWEFMGKFTGRIGKHGKTDKFIGIF